MAVRASRAALAASGCAASAAEATCLALPARSSCDSRTCLSFCSAPCSSSNNELCDGVGVGVFRSRVGTATMCSSTCSGLASEACTSQLCCSKRRWKASISRLSRAKRSSGGSGFGSLAESILASERGRRDIRHPQKLIRILIFFGLPRFVLAVNTPLGVAPLARTHQIHY